MITRRSIFGMAAGLAALVGMPAWAREPRHTIWYSVEQLDVPLLNIDEYQKRARDGFSDRRGDLSTVEFYGKCRTGDPRIVRYYWKCERDNKIIEENRISRHDSLESRMADLRSNRHYDIDQKTRDKVEAMWRYSTQMGDMGWLPLSSRSPTASARAYDLIAQAARACHPAAFMA